MKIYRINGITIIVVCNKIWKLSQRTSQCLFLIIFSYSFFFFEKYTTHPKCEYNIREEEKIEEEEFERIKKWSKRRIRNGTKNVSRKSNKAKESE